MPKIYTFIFLLFVSFSSVAQSKITLKGKILDKNTQVPIEAATVYLTSVKDSSVIEYTISDKNGMFKIDTRKITKPFFLKISFQGYDTFKQEITALKENKDFGILYLTEIINTLNEVVIKSEAPPIRIKKDTLEFNASSFKVRPDSNVETLLKQLPGVEVGSDGKITVNGKEVNQILVNGKPFFDKDGKIALQSLPSDIINKVQITDTKTKKEELAGQVASSNNASINLTIDEDKNKGFFGKFMGGYGTDERYESSALINYFKNKRKISVLASSNNINSTGFSMDEVFDNMGGGRNSYYSGDGSFGIGSLRFGGYSGITQSDMLGVNYDDELVKDFKSTASYFYTDQHSKNNNRTKQIKLFSTQKITTDSNAKTDSDAFSHNMNAEFEYTIDSTASIVVTPKFSKGNNKSHDKSYEVSRDENNNLMNDSDSETFNDKEAVKFNNGIFFNKKLNKKGKFISLSFENENTSDDISVFNKSKTIYYQEPLPDDNRDQIRKNRNLKDLYTLNLGFSQPIKDSLKVRIEIEYESNRLSENRTAFDYDVSTQEYTNENDLLSNYLTSGTKTIKTGVGINQEKKKMYFDITAGTMAAQFDNQSVYRGTTTTLSKNYLLPYASSFVNYKINKTKSIYGNYSFGTSFPSASQVLPVENLANPLNTFVGNPDLDVEKTHYLYLSFRDFNTATRAGYSFYVGGNYFENQVVSSSVYDSNGKSVTTYKNIAGNYYTWSGINWNKSIKRDGNVFKFSLGGGANFSKSKGYTNSEIYDAFGVRLRLRSSFTYEYGELFTINPSYNYTNNTTEYSNYRINSATTYQHQLNIQTTNYWPKNWVFGNDFGYTYNSNIADGFKKDFYLWNTSLSYSFFGKKMTAKVKVYDLLNQNQSTTRTISATSIRDEENTVLKRYVMFSLTYKIEKFAGKEKPARNRMMF